MRKARQAQGLCCRGGAVGVALLLFALLAPRARAADPFLWLESASSPRAMTWVREQDAASLKRLQADPRYPSFYATALSLGEDPARIPLPQQIGGMVYNLWQDASHVQGIWRRTTPQDYRNAVPHWTTVLDLDALGKREGHRWVFKGATCAEPAETRCLIALSDGGEDAVTNREFDLAKSAFVPNGFVLPRSKMTVDWRDADTLLVATDWGPGSMTQAGYPYKVRALKRGQPLSAATPYFSGMPTDEGVQLSDLSDGAGHHAFLITRELDFFHFQFLQAKAGPPTPLPLPPKTTPVGLLNNRLIVLLDEAAGTIPAGSLAALDLTIPTPKLAPVFTPGPRQSVDEMGLGVTRAAIVAVVNDNVRGRGMVFLPQGAGYISHTLALPDDQAVALVDATPHTDTAFFTATGFLNPATLYATIATTSGATAALKSQPARFDASHDVVEQREATSADGTKIPYFIVHPKTMVASGANPTLLYAYGGFQISEVPTYAPVMGKLWLEHGGVYVLANIRGGGEFGPAWHEAALKTNRQRAYDDFAAVARDLIATKVTDPAHLGIRGGSNGGLLMGVEFTEHPDLFRAVIIDVPLLDMLRISQIAAGASWEGEYGAVTDPAVLAFWQKTSPYAALRSGVAYPEPFIFTTTKDDRVGPQHARKFAAKMAALHLPYYYYESIEGGHAAGANLKEKAHESALEFTYLAEKLTAP